MLELIVLAILLGLIPATIMGRIGPADDKTATFIIWWVFGALMFIIALPMALYFYVTQPNSQQQPK